MRFRTCSVERRPEAKCQHRHVGCHIPTGAGLLADLRLGASSVARLLSSLLRLLASLVASLLNTAKVPFLRARSEQSTARLGLLAPFMIGRQSNSVSGKAVHKFAYQQVAYSYLCAPSLGPC